MTGLGEGEPAAALTLLARHVPRVVASFLAAVLSMVALECGIDTVLAADPAAPTFDNTIVPLERAGRHLGRALTVFGVMSANLSTPEIQALDKTWSPKIAAAAEPWGIRLAPHLFHETMVHLLASIPNASYLEYMDWNDDLWIEPVLPSKNGTMSPPERPGHGLAFRPEILKDHRIGGQRLKG